MSETWIRPDKEEGKKSETEAGNQVNTQSTEVTVQNEEKATQWQASFTINTIEQSLMNDLKEAS